MTDTLSDLMWQWAGQGNCDWQEMLAYCEGLDFAGHADWRVPDIKELETIVGAEAYLSIGQGVYCSSTTIADDNASIWLIQFSSTSNYGDVFQHGAGTSKYFCASFYFRCVR